jgi:hypothetical protein
MKNTLSLIEELDKFIPTRDKHQVIESRASNAIASCINIMQLISESFSDEDAADLNNRILLAIKNKDANKFNRKIREMKKLKK